MVSQAADPLENVIKIVLLGDSLVGKTSLAMQYKHEGQYSILKIKPSLGIEFVKKDSSIVPEGQDLKTIQIWDRGRLESAKEDNKAPFHRGAAGAMIVYSANDSSSFDNVNHWVQEWNTYKQDKAFTMLVCNKIDLAPDSDLIEKGQQFSKQHGYLFEQTSAIGEHYASCQKAFDLFSETIICS